MRTVIFILVCLSSVFSCQGRTITVDCNGSADFVSIQPAIDASWAGDAIVVRDGIYRGTGNENIRLRGKAITVASEQGPDKCIIDCQHDPFRREKGFIFSDGEGRDTLLDGFTIRNATCAIVCETGSSPTILNCNIRGNTSLTYSAGVFCLQSSPRVVNCVMADNYGPSAGAVYCKQSSAIFTNCTICDNTGGKSGAFLIDSFCTGIKITNCILWDNQPVNFVNHCGACYSVTYSDVQGGITGTGNRNSDPKFSFEGHYTVMDGSPCINAGSNFPSGGLHSTDVVGNPRIVGGIVDMGAYEQPSGAIIEVERDFFLFSAPEHSDTVCEGLLRLRNRGSGVLYWVVEEDCNWLSVSETSGSSAGEVDQVTLSADSNGLSRGLYRYDLVISDSHNPHISVVVEVEFVIEGILRVPGVFSTIQEAIDHAQDGDTVEVDDGIYQGEGNRDLDFCGKAITVKSRHGPHTCIIDCGGSEAAPHRGFYFHNYEDMNSVVDGFAICNGFIGTSGSGGGIYCFRSSPQVKSCIIRDNSASVDGGGICFNGSQTSLVECIIFGNRAGFDGGGIRWSGGGTISNCVIAGNQGSKGGGIYSGRAHLTIRNCTFLGNRAIYRGGGFFTDGGASTLSNSIFWANSASRGKELYLQSDYYREGSLATSYNDIQGGPSLVGTDSYFTLDWGTGHIDADPCFADRGYWDVNGTPDDTSDDSWTEGDHHLRSAGGRWDSNSGSWVCDDVTSPCIDKGDPNSDVCNEPPPDGGRINMGAYGGMSQASKSPTCWSAAECAGQPSGDATCDGNTGLADLFALKAAFGMRAPYATPYCCSDFNHDGFVNLGDLFTLRANYGRSGYSPSAGNQNCPPW
ncbi:MAG: choice-of-anchor Q domain-containing protein [Planctomycetota bacterium]